MALDARTLDALASCLEYPRPDAASLAREAASALASSEPGLAAALWALAVFLELCPPGEAEERYTALFDVNPVCTLHVGYHVFGDTYPRGELLAGLAAELRRAEVEANGDLPDFLPTLLRLLSRLGPEDARLLREAALLPGLEKMSRALAQSKDPWSRVVRALGEALAEEGDAVVEPRQCALADAGFGHRLRGGPGSHAGSDHATADPAREPSGSAATRGLRQCPLG
jgi:nitrate reductase delta subunit